MKDIALVSEGTHVYFASCRDEKYPLNNIIDGKWDTFWPTSGLFPHSFIVTFRCLMKVVNLVVQSYNVKLIRIDKSKNEFPVEFEKYIDQQACDHQDRRMHTLNINETCTCRHLRFVILSGHDHFTAIHNLQIMAEPAPQEVFAPEMTLRPQTPPKDEWKTTTSAPIKTEISEILEDENEEIEDDSNIIQTID